MIWNRIFKRLKKTWGRHDAEICQIRDGKRPILRRLASDID